MDRARTTALFSIAVVEGGYMLFDAIHKLAFGVYFGGRLGPWSRVVASIGIRPDAMAPVFVVLGVAWLVGAALLILRSRTARALLTMISLLSLFYLVFGTVLSVTALILLAGTRSVKKQR